MNSAATTSCSPARTLPTATAAAARHGQWLTENGGAVALVGALLHGRRQLRPLFVWRQPTSAKPLLCALNVAKHVLLLTDKHCAAET